MPIYENENDGSRCVHLGGGDVAICLAAGSDELVFFGQGPQPVGAPVELPKGDTTANHRGGVRIIIGHPDALDVLIERATTLRSRIRLRGAVVLVLDSVPA